MSDPEPLKHEFPAWAAPFLGALVGAFLAFCTLLQNEPLSPLAPWLTITLGVLMGELAGALLGLWEHWRH